MAEETAREQLPRWRPAPGLDPVHLANALEVIRVSAWSHYHGGAFEPKHMQGLSMLAADALAGLPIAAPPDMNAPEFQAAVDERFERLQQLWDEDPDERTAVHAHEHAFAVDPDRPDTHRCTAPRCTALLRVADAHHIYRELRTPEGLLVAVDEVLSGLLDSLWAAGAVTYDSCQGGCAIDAAGTMTPAYLSFRAADLAIVGSTLDGLPGLYWSPPDKHGRQLVEWTSTSRCSRWETERAAHTGDDRADTPDTA